MADVVWVRGGLDAPLVALKDGQFQINADRHNGAFLCMTVAQRCAVEDVVAATLAGQVDRAHAEKYGIPDMPAGPVVEVRAPERMTIDTFRERKAKHNHSRTDGGPNLSRAARPHVPRLPDEGG